MDEPFLGTGGNWLGLIIGFLCLGISVLTYMPFVLAANKMMASDSQSDKNTQDAADGSTAEAAKA